MSLRRGAAGHLDRLTAPLLDLLFPGGCSVCGGPIPPGLRLGLCAACDATVRHFGGTLCSVCGVPCGPVAGGEAGEAWRCGECLRHAVPYDGALSFGAHSGPLRDLVHRLKFHGMTGLVEPLAARVLSEEGPREFLGRAEMLVPVPLSLPRHLIRGFNQAGLLALALGRRAGIPVCRVLRKTRLLGGQRGLSADERRRSVRGAFRLRRGAQIRGKVVCLVDDVWTTGSTVEEACREIRKGRPRGVLAFTLSRALRGVP